MLKYRQIKSVEMMERKRKNMQRGEKHRGMWVEGGGRDGKTNTEPWREQHKQDRPSDLSGLRNRENDMWRYEHRKR